MKRLILVDGYSLFFRAYFATAYTGQFMHTSEGVPTNAIFSFSNMMFRILGEHNFTHIMVALDPGGKTFRHGLLPEYKGTRSETPEEMIPQFDLLPQLLDALNIKYYKKTNFEADDLIGTLAKQAEADGFHVDVLSSDRDLLQLIDEHTTIRLLKKGLSEIQDMGLAELQDELSLEPYQITDLKGLMGDSADNIPGIPGVGPKTALKLLHQYQTVENIYANIDELKGKQKEKFITYQEQALLSKELATINCAVDIDIQLADLQYTSINLAASEQFFRSIESKTLLKKAQNMYDLQQTIEVIDDQCLMDGLLKDLPQCAIELTPADASLQFDEEMMLYFEHPYENYHEHKEPLYIGIKSQAYSYLLTWADFQNNKSVQQWLANDQMHKIVYDSKKIYALCQYANLEIQGITFDVMLASYVMNPSNKIEELADITQLFDYSLSYMENIYGKNTKFSIADTDKIMQYTQDSIEALAFCFKRLYSTLVDDDLLHLLEDVEMPLARILANMEVTGVYVQKDVLVAQGEIIQERIGRLEQEIYTLAGKTFNIASPKQLGEVLFDDLHLPVIKKTKTGYSTAANVLEELMQEHAIIPLIGEYRQLTKLNSTYIKGLQPMIASDGKIHTIYKQAQTQTGRLSSIEPNLQNIPIKLEEGRLIRKAFVASPNCRLIASDYSQIELRVLAELADVQELKDAFIHQRDIHTETAMKIFDVTDTEVTSLMRSQAKSVNFGIIYGMSDFGLATQLGISRKQAKIFIEKYFALFPGVKEYMERTIQSAQDLGYVETVLKRRRYFPTIHSRNFNERNFAKRAAMNAPIQGSAADILKLAMVAIDTRMKDEQLQSKMILQVHDELIFDVPMEEIAQMKELVATEMTKAFVMSVPLAVGMEEGINWYDAK